MTTDHTPPTPGPLAQAAAPAYIEAALRFVAEPVKKCQELTRFIEIGERVMPKLKVKLRGRHDYWIVTEAESRLTAARKELAALEEQYPGVVGLAAAAVQIEPVNEHEEAPKCWK